MHTHTHTIDVEGSSNVVLDEGGELIGFVEATNAKAYYVIVALTFAACMQPLII